MRTKHIPGIDYPPLWCRKWFLEALGAVPVVIAAAFTATKFWQDDEDKGVAYIAIGVVIWIVFLSTIKILVAKRHDRKETPEETHDGLYGAVSTAHAAVKYVIETRTGEPLDLRATFHRVVPPLHNPQKLQQIIPYVGGDGAGLGREFSINTGITGQAIRNKEPYTMASVATTETEHRAELVADWGYTSTQAAQLAPGRVSAAALPVLDRSGRHVLGVIYLDSSGSRVFGEPETNQLLIAIGDSIGDYVTRRY